MQEKPARRLPDGLGRLGVGLGGHLLPHHFLIVPVVAQVSLSLLQRHLLDDVWGPTVVSPQKSEIFIHLNEVGTGNQKLMDLLQGFYDLISRRKRAHMLYKGLKRDFRSRFPMIDG